MNKLNYFGTIDVDDLREQYQEYAEVIGVENLFKLCCYCGGTQIYIPKADELLKELKYKCIREEYNGDNIRYLAKKYNISESTVYRIVRDMSSTIKNKPIEGQISLFDSQTHCQ